LRIRARTQHIGNRSGQLIDATFEPPGNLSVGFHERCHFLNGIQQSFLQFQFSLQSISL
jgi:hypothetical protein